MILMRECGTRKGICSLDQVWLSGKMDAQKRVHEACALYAFGVVQIVPEDHGDTARLYRLVTGTLREDGEDAVQHHLHVGIRGEMSGSAAIRR